MGHGLSPNGLHRAGAQHCPPLSPFLTPNRARMVLPQDPSTHPSASVLFSRFSAAAGVRLPQPRAAQARPLQPRAQPLARRGQPARTRSRTRTARTCTRTCAHAHMRARTHARTRTRAHTHTHTNRILVSARLLPLLVPVLGGAGARREPYAHGRRQVSTRILGRRTAPFTTFLVPHRVPHGFTPRS